MGKICAFFGHREILNDIIEPLRQAIQTAITEYGATSFWVGGYGQFDYCAESNIRRLKKEFPEISLQLIVAYLPTGDNIPENTYDSIVYPEGLELVPKRFAISRRNQWIIKNCDMVIAYINHSYGGAYSAYKAARRKGIRITNIGSLCE